MTRRTVMLFAAALAGCTAKKEPAFDYGAAEKKFPMRGEVLRLKPEMQVAVVKHETIEGWMEAMTMDFPVPSAEEFAKLKEGMKITATVEMNDLHYWLTNIQPQQ